MARLAWLIPMLVVLAWPPTTAARPGEGKSGELIIRLDKDMLTLKAREVPQRQILEGLAKRLNFELVVTGSLEERRSLEIEGRPWEEVLKKALAPASWAFVYRSSGDQPRLAKVFVFPSKAGSSIADPTANPDRAASPPPAPPAQTTRPQAAVAPKPGSETTEPSLAQMLESTDEETRALALIGLATMGDEQATAAITRALRDQVPWVRETAVEALAEIGGEQAIRGLQQALNDENPDVQKAALEALHRLQSNTQ